MKDLSARAIQKRIQGHRFADVTVRVRREDGSALALSEIAVEQTAHAFLFGQVGFEIVRSRQVKNHLDEEWICLYKERIQELFNAMTLPFYWASFEPAEGLPHTQELLEAARWCTEHGLTVKGHPLCWHTLCPDWLMSYPNEAILQKQQARIRRDVSDFAGLVDMWDVVNEPVIMPVYEKYDNAMTRIAAAYGTTALIDTCFREARSADPRATLLINDFNLGPDYEQIIESLLAQGTPIDAIGLQTHQHQGYLGKETIWDCAERFSRFGLPLYFTENTILSGQLMPGEIEDLNDFRPSEWPTTPEGEERQCRETIEFCSLLYSHPAVHGITWWGLPDGIWLNAPGGLVRRDMSPKPVYEALKELIKGKWWTARQQLRTDAEGTVTLRASLGAYRLTARGAEARFTVARDSRALEVRLQA